METKHIFIGDYINKNPRERIYHLMDNYKDFGKYRESYKDNVVDLMVAMREYNIRPSDEDLGIRVQTSGGTSNITASKALERIVLENCFVKMRVPNESYEAVKVIREKYGKSDQMRYVQEIGAPNKRPSMGVDD